jgi:hypothetical protein
MDKCELCGLGEKESAKESLWTQCDECVGWFHNVCAGIKQAIENGEEWQCASCKTNTEENEKAIAEEKQKLQRKKVELEKARNRDRKKKELEEIKRQLQECESELLDLSLSDNEGSHQHRANNGNDLSSLLQQ